MNVCLDLLLDFLLNPHIASGWDNLPLTDLFNGISERFGVKTNALVTFLNMSEL